jgi:arylsulfatase A
VRFTQAYAMSVCSPTRAALLTGKHAARLHFTTWREAAVERLTPARRGEGRLVPPPTTTDLPFEELTIAELLKAAGYLTFHVGKWHLGDAGHAPEAHGFDVNVGATHWGAPATYFHPFRGPFGADREFRYVPGLGLGRPGEYLTDRLTDEALNLIEAAGDRPFLLNLWFHNPHTPIEGKPELVEAFRRELRPGLHHQNPGYAAMIQTLDDNVGRILDHLARRGLAGRTLVVFTSDNGGQVGQYRGHRVTDNAPLRSGKGSLYEGGIRVPLLMRLPGVTSPGAACHEPVICMDLFRTIAEVVGVSGLTGLDGVSLVPLLRNPQASLARDALCFHYPHYYSTTTPVSAIRAGDWKLLEFFDDGRLELFNLRDDPGEQHDRATEEAARARELWRQLEAWRQAVGAQRPEAP